MPLTPRSIVLHGHFYQPPREDPWSDEVPRQPSAAPFHDWNERIEHECYGAIVKSRVLGNGEDDDEVLNALDWMSFDFGPTLLVWLERHAPDTYRAILEADRESAGRHGGHGNALAMPYHHPILPLSTPRDRLTEIRWGIADFRRRFGREPEGMWMPETAVDEATLDALASERIRFTIVAPHQVDPAPEDGRPVRYVTRGGREIALFVYDGALSHGVAFGDLLTDGVGWAAGMADDPDGSALRSVATDGETFGHHHKFSEMALAKAIAELRRRKHVRLESFASYLAREGAHETAALVAPSSWSCAHGVDRWRFDCGCRADHATETHQAWRMPLRAALEWLAAGLHIVYEEEGSRFLEDPWAVRDAYGEVVGLLDPAPAERFVSDRLGPNASSSVRARALELLEMERNALRLFTSCAWFFDDVGSLEPRQVLLYAARAIEQAGPAGELLREGFVERLADAESNDPEVGTAADIFEEAAEARGEASPA